MIHVVPLTGTRSEWDDFDLLKYVTLRDLDRLRSLCKGT